ncbi:hypothetical protein [Protofrankia coriariae]|uniref:Uncharacterized protein n=1 Tax=Protofrankia coriariae TaxID=1562887 RepID=A0ABR5F204_9ACTN|nr:hypothetical protein [Protofrankia coriariae]KLL10757.1 hypothetical protein FrCorBMG51_15830 [Protofrankia coriariae]
MVLGRVERIERVVEQGAAVEQVTAEASLRALRNQWDEVGQQLLDLLRTPELLRITELDRRLTGFDIAAFRSASTRVERDQRVEELVAARDSAKRRLWEAERVRDSCRSAASDAAAALAAVERARSDLAEVIRLRTEVQRLEARAAHTASMALFAERRLRDARRQRTRLANDWRSDRFGNRNERSRLGSLVSRRQAEFGAAVTAAAEADRLLCQHRARVEPLIAAHERAATSVTVEEIARRDAAAGQAWSALAEANRACRAVAEEADRCEAALAEAARQPGATDEDRKTVEDAEHAGCPALVRERERLVELVAPLLARRRELERRYERLLADTARYPSKEAC